MPISRYDIICATHPSDLNTVMADGSYVAIGYVFAQPSYGLQAVGVGSIDPWGSVHDYELIQAQFYKDLIPLVNEKIKQGYQPIGGLAHWANAFVQAVGKVDGSSSGGGSGGGGDFPKGSAFDVLSYDAAGNPVAKRISMENWIGGELPASADNLEFAPITMTSTGQAPLQSFRPVEASALSSSIMMRDANGGTCVTDAAIDDQAVNLGQVKALMAQLRKDIEDNIIDVINNAIGGGSNK